MVSDVDEAIYETDFELRVFRRDGRLRQQDVTEPGPVGRDFGIWRGVRDANGGGREEVCADFAHGLGTLKMLIER